MSSFRGKHMILLVGALVCVPLLKRLLPICTPFLLGLGLALAAEPTVRRLEHRLGRGAAAGIGVTGIFALSTTLLVFLLSLLLRQLGRLSQWLPAVTEAVSQGAGLLRQWLLSLCRRAPGEARQVLEGLIGSLFDGSAGLLQQAAGKLAQLAGNLLGRLSNGFIGGVTAALAAFMISARLPQLRQAVLPRLPAQLFPAMKGFRRTLGRWLLAQGKLAGVAFLLLLTGFLLLRLPHPLLWAMLVTMVDILPILGVGTVLVPWSLVCYLQGDTPQALGLLGIFGVIWLVRSVLEPRLIGKELGLDPLVTLLCIYAGFRLWGILGMLLAPMAAVCLVQLRRGLRTDNRPGPAQSP